jgi:hypothetical protein
MVLGQRIHPQSSLAEHQDHEVQSVAGAKPGGQGRQHWPPCVSHTNVLACRIPQGEAKVQEKTLEPWIPQSLKYTTPAQQLLN